MFDFPHSPASFEPLLDSDRAAAIIRVHPQDTSALRTKWDCSWRASRQAVALPGLRPFSIRRTDQPARRRPQGTVGWNQPLVPVTREEINPC